LFSVCQQQPEPFGDTGSNFQNSDQCWANSQWGTGSATTTQDQDGSGHELSSTGDNYGNSETFVGGNMPGQQPFSYWDVSANHTEVRKF